MPKEKTASDATGSRSLTGLKKYILPSLASLIITAFVGDLLIKRNIEGFTAELRAFKAEPALARDEFNDMRKQINDLIRERRQIILLINGYAAERDFENLLAHYREYETVKDKWNAELDTLANTMRQMTACQTDNGAGPFDDAKKRQILEAVVEKGNTLGATASKPPAFPDDGVIKVDDTEFDRILRPNAFCPHHFLTDRRNGFDTDTAEPPYSVREMFLRANSLIYRNLHSETMKFIQIKDRLLDAALSRCALSPSTQEHVSCISEAVVAFRDIQCPHCPEDDLKVMTDRDFLELDYRWYVGNQMLLAFRRDYIQKRCEEKIAFWGSLLGRRCDA